MPTSLDGQLVVAISSRALFDFEQENNAFDPADDTPYRALQLARLEAPAPHGVAFPLIKKLLQFSTPDVQRVSRLPPAGNANCAWVQHCIHHLAPSSTSSSGARTTRRFGVV